MGREALKTSWAQFRPLFQPEDREKESLVRSLLLGAAWPEGAGGGHAEGGGCERRCGLPRRRKGSATPSV